MGNSKLCGVPKPTDRHRTTKSGTSAGAIVMRDPISNVRREYHETTLADLVQMYVDSMRGVGSDEQVGDHCEIEQALPAARAALAKYREMSR